MIISTSDFIKQYDIWFNNNKTHIQKKYKEFIVQRTNFCDLYGTENKLSVMTLDDYVFQTKGRKDSLCYLIDYGTDECGINRNANQPGYFRYGIQLDKTGKHYYPFMNGKTSKYGKDETEVFNHFKKETIKLLKATKKQRW